MMDPSIDTPIERFVVGGDRGEMVISPPINSFMVLYIEGSIVEWRLCERGVRSYQQRDPWFCCRSRWQRWLRQLQMRQPQPYVRSVQQQLPHMHKSHIPKGLWSKNENKVNYCIQSTSFFSHVNSSLFIQQTKLTRKVAP